MTASIPKGFQFTQKAPGIGIFITGHQNLIFRLRNSDVWMKEQILLTQKRIGTKLVRDARVTWAPHSRTGTVDRNIQFETKELTNTYRLYFGLANASASRGSFATGSKAAGGGVEGTPGEAAHGIWINKGTGIYGLWHRPYPERRKGSHAHGRPVRLMKGMQRDLWLDTAKNLNYMWIQDQYKDLGRKFIVYTQTGAPPS